MKKRHTAAFKARVALEALRDKQTMAALSSQYGVHRVQIQQWKKVALEGLKRLFSSKTPKAQRETVALQEELYKQIGQLKVENDWLKKISG